MNPLTPNEIKVLRLRFAIDLPETQDTTAKETLKTIGKEMGFSYTCAQFVEQAGLKKLGVSSRDAIYNRKKVRKLVEEQCH